MPLAEARPVMTTSRVHRPSPVWGGVYLLVVIVAALETPAAFAQDQEPTREQRENAATGSTSSADAPAESKQAIEPPPAQGEAPANQASAAQRGRAIEEIVVTAERREERLHDVPVSMSALDTGFMRQQGITDLQDVSRYVPNVRFSQAGSIIEPRIRGFGTQTTVNRGLELPVGIAIDEVPYSRAEYFTSGLFDVDRVEVLRGAQGQLFGSNTAVGLVNVTTKNPTDQFTGSIDSELGELGTRRFEGGVGGPLIPGFLNFRLAALSDERDGYVRNTTAAIVPEAGKLLGSRLRQSGRVKLEFPNLFGGDLLLSYQRDFLDFGGTPREITSLPVKFRSLFQQYDPNVDFTPNNLVGSIDSPQFNRANLNTLAARGHYDLGRWGLNLVAGWAELKNRNLDDADSTPTNLTDGTFTDETSRQSTFELRVESPDLQGFFGLGKLLGLSLGSTDFTSGFFFQRRKQAPTKLIQPEDGVLLLLAEALDQLPPNQPVPFVTKPPPDPEMEFIDNRFEQTANEFAGFGQMNWHFFDRWTLLYGMRLDGITKDVSVVQVVHGTVISNLEASFNNPNLKDREFHFSPKVGMKYDPTEAIDFYWSWSSNFQAGGFNNFSTSADPQRLVVKPANVTDYEVGTKLRLFDGAAELNLGGFWMTLNNFQVFTLLPQPNGIPAASVINIGELRARGVESDLTWLPTEWLTLRGSLGFNDTEYLIPPPGVCLADVTNCDLKGKPFEQAPEWDISVTPAVRVPLASIPGLGAMLPSFLREVALTSALTGQWTDHQFLDISDDARTRQPSFFRVDGNVGFANASQGWSVQLRVENLTDERTANTAFAVPAFNGGVFKAPEPPRVMMAVLRWEF